MSTAGGIVRSTVSDFTWKPNRADPQDSRLWAALLDARRRLTALMDARGPDDRIVNACADCLQRADAEAASSRYVAWDCLHQFDAETFSAMSDQQLQARWCTLRAEAEDKLKGGWRSQAAGSLVKLVKPSPESTP